MINVDDSGAEITSNASHLSRLSSEGFQHSHAHTRLMTDVLYKMVLLSAVPLSAVWGTKREANLNMTSLGGGGKGRGRWDSD